MIVDSISKGISYNTMILKTAWPPSPFVLIQLEKTPNSLQEGVSSIPIPMPTLLDMENYNTRLNHVFSIPCSYYPFPEQKERRATFPSFYMQYIKETLSSEVLLVKLF